MASNFNQQQGYGSQHPVHPVGDQIAAKQGGVLYEDEAPGASLSGGANPSTGQSIHTKVNGSGGQGQVGSQQFQGTPAVPSLGGSSPQVTDVGIKTSTQPQTSQAGTSAQGNQASAAATDGASTLYDQAARGAQVAAVKAQELAEPIQPYIQKVQETVTPYVQNAVDSAGPYVQQAREVASPYVEKASALASQGIQATAAELEKRGVNMDNVQQSLKDYGAVGQQRAGEYLQQAVDQANTLGRDGENRNIVATVFGTIALIWLAFGFSITALLALGIAGGLAAILSRYSRAAVGTRGQPSASVTGSRPTAASGVETHYPNRAHPDNSLNN